MEEQGSITVYNPSMAAKIAEMFNAFNEIWPGGFTGGIPYTEQRVHDFLDKTSAIADLIAIDSEQKPVGYCGLYPHWRDKNAAYISILGVHPKVKGKKFGKRLLLKALEVAKENGILRVDLQTWSGNMDAVPLYKKVGLFWVPDTNVYMQDFIPGILQNALAKEWFEKHPNWYGNFRRELNQTPDEENIDGMDVFSYHFEEEGDKLSVLVDRYGWGFTGIERLLDGKKLSIKSRLESHKIFMGIENRLVYTIENKTEEDLEIKLSVEAFDGLKWRDSFPDSLKIPTGETVSVDCKFLVDHTARKHKTVQRGSEVIETVFSFDSYEIQLSTGGKIHPAIDLLSYENYINVPVGRDKTVYLDLRNYTKEKLSGKIVYYTEGIDEHKHEIKFSVKPEELTGIEIPLSIPKGSQINVFNLKATPYVNINQLDFQMPEYNISLISNKPEVVEVVKGADEDTLHLITDFWAVQIAVERANIQFRRRYVDDVKVLSLFEIGPPYGLDLDRTLKFDYRIERNGKELTLILEANSLQVEGLKVIKYLKVCPGLKEIEHWIELENITSNGIITTGGRVTVTSAGGLNVNPIGSFAQVYTPVYGEIIECDPTFPVMSQTLVSDKPDDWHETWTAGKLLGESNLSAVIWNPENVQRIKVNKGFIYTLESNQYTLNSKEKAKVVHFWYAHSMNSIRDVRLRWNQLIDQKDMTMEESIFGVKTRRPIRAEFADSNIITKGKAIEKTIELFSFTPYPLPGKLTLNLPDNWKGFFKTEKGKELQIDMPKLSSRTAVSLKIEISVPENYKKSSGTISLNFEGEYEIEFKVPVLLKGSSEVTVQGGKIQEQEVMIVNNGKVNFKVPSNIGGCLIQLEDIEGTTFLLDNFPNVEPKFFVENYLGGLQPGIFHPNEGNPFAELEETEIEEVSDGEWKGVKTFWKNKKSEWLKEQNYAISYLTLPDSNLLRLKFENINNTPRNVFTIAAMIADIALKGDTTGNVIEVPGGIGHWIRNHVQKPFLNQTNIEEPWVRVIRDDKSLTFLSPEGYFGSNTIFDSQMMLLNILVSFMKTQPNQTSTNEFVVMVNEPKDAIEEVRKCLQKK